MCIFNVECVFSILILEATIQILKKMFLFPKFFLYDTILFVSFNYCIFSGFVWSHEVWWDNKEAALSCQQ